MHVLLNIDYIVFYDERNVTRETLFPLLYLDGLSRLQPTKHLSPFIPRCEIIKHRHYTHITLVIQVIVTLSSALYRLIVSIPLV